MMRQRAARYCLRSDAARQHLRQISTDRRHAHFHVAASADVLKSGAGVPPDAAPRRRADAAAACQANAADRAPMPFRPQC